MRRQWTVLCGSAVLCLSACAPKEASPATGVGAGQVESARVLAHPDAVSSMDLISPANCASSGTHLTSCVIPTRSLNFTPFTSAVPLRTTISAVRSGTCSTPYTLQVALTPTGGAATNFAYIAGGSTVLRGASGALLNGLTIADSSPWTKFAAVDKSCHISLSISDNEIDVDTTAQAQAIIAQLQADASAKTNTAARYQELMLYAQAYGFLQAIANNFLGQLTDQSLQDLRAAAQPGVAALVPLITSCDGSITADQKTSLFQLAMALGKLDDPSAWQNADGSIKTLNDFLGADDAQVIATINQLAQNAAASDGGAVDYSALYQKAEQDAATAAAKLVLAQQQLAPWLNP